MILHIHLHVNTGPIIPTIRDARALYLRRHWTIERLSMFDVRRLKYCLLMECNEMQTLVDQEDFCKRKTKSTSHGEGEILGSLQYLSIHFMKKLQRISKGPLGRNSLSCLRVLALHTCPELTSIFTESLLDNLKSLTEIIVEDCPKVNCLVNLEEGALRNKGPFLPNVRKISLLDLPGLVSVSGGVCIAPQLDTLLVFNCMKLDHLSDTEIPRDTMAIKGEIEWWDALKSGKSTWERVFVQLKRYGSLMDQLAEDTNSLRHFLELKMDHSLPGQVNQNSSRATKEDREHVDQLKIVHNVDLSKIHNCNNGTQSQYAETAFKMWEPPCPVSGKLDNKDTSCLLKDPNHKLASTKKKSRSADIAKWIQRVKGNPTDTRKYLQKESLNFKYTRNHRKISVITSKHQVKVNKGIEVEKALDDGYSWRKYGEKSILGSTYPRSYYRCIFGSTNGCCAKKQVQRCDKDPSIFEVFYRGRHTCPTVLSNNFPSTATESTCTTAKEPASTITESLFDLPKSTKMLDSNKIKSISTTDAKSTKQLKVNPNSDFDTPTDDGFGLNFTNKMSGSASIHRRKQRAEEIQLSSAYEPNVLMAPYMGQGTALEPQQQAPKQNLRKLRSQGLCLVPVSTAFLVTDHTTADFSRAIFGEHHDEAEDLFSNAYWAPL